MARGSIERELGKTPEKPVEIKRFTTEQANALRGDHLIHELTGKSIKDFVEQGRKILPGSKGYYLGSQDERSRPSQVAISRRGLFLPNSNNIVFKKQEKMVADYSKRLGQKIPGIEAIIGQAPDYVELVFAHLDKTGQRLFGIDNGLRYTRTKTRGTDNFSCLVVGGFDNNGLDIGSWYLDKGPKGYGSSYGNDSATGSFPIFWPSHRTENYYMYIAPLIVPA